MSKIGRGLAIVVPWSIALVMAIYVLSLRFPPSGMVHFSEAFDGSGIWFTPFTPGERVTSPGMQEDGWRGQRILDEPVYARARWPGAYDHLSLTFDMSTTRQSLAEIGILRDEATRAFEMQPLWSAVLMSEAWREVSLDESHGFVRADLPDTALLEQDPGKLMTWHASTTRKAVSDTGDALLQTYDVSLRGTHNIQVLPINNELFFQFKLQDMNRNRDGKNTVAMRVTCDNRIIWTQAGSASGLHDARPSEVFTEEVSLKALEPCVYRVSILADNDFFIREIKTTAKHWVFGPEIFFGDHVGYRTTSTAAIAWTNSLHAVVDTFHDDGKQIVHFGTKQTEIRETHARYALDRAPEERDVPIRFTAPNGNVRVIGDGYFALSQDALFYPEPRRLTAESMPLEEGIDAVLTPFHTPEKLDNGFWRTTVDFDLVKNMDQLQFSLAAPGIARSQGAVDIRHVTLDYTRPKLSFEAWWRVVKRELFLALKRL